MVDGVAYRTRRISARDQWALYRLLMPILPALSGLDAGLRLPGLKIAAVAALFAPLREAGDEVMDAVFAACLAAVERVDAAPVASPRLAGLFAVTMHVVSVNFGPLFSMKRVKFDPCPTGKGDRGFGDLGPVTMPDDEDRLYAPAMAGLCRWIEIEDGTYQIEHIVKMNEALAVRSENEARLHYAAEQA